MVSDGVSAAEQMLSVPKIARAAPQSNEKVVALSGHSFGFSPFIEEGLVLDMPEATSRKFPKRIFPAYLEEFGTTSN
jgi:hypothetical protein